MYDKDKLYIIASLYVKNVNKDIVMYTMNEIRNHIQSSVDDSVKVFVFPVLLPEFQKLEIINPNQSLKPDTIEHLNNTYNKLIDEMDNFLEKNEENK